MDGIALRFEEEALKKVVELTQEKEMGARGLRAVLETIMLKSCSISRLETTLPNALLPRIHRTQGSADFRVQQEASLIPQSGFEL